MLDYSLRHHRPSARVLCLAVDDLSEFHCQAGGLVELGLAQKVQIYEPHSENAPTPPPHYSKLRRNHGLPKEHSVKVLKSVAINKRKRTSMSTRKKIISVCLGSDENCGFWAKEIMLIIM